MVRNCCRASVRPSPAGNSALIGALMSSAVQVPEEVTSKGGDSLGSGERCSVHAAANKPPTRSALLRNARRIAILSALGSPALRRQRVPHTHTPCHPGQDEQEKGVIA